MNVQFEEKHFAAFSEDRATLQNIPERKEVRDLLLDLDDAIPPALFPETEILGIDLHRHWSSEHRTALWFPHVMNGMRVDELYLRYGKSETQIKSVAKLIPPAIDEPPELGGFPSHAHLSTGLCSDCFFFQFVAGPKAWLDLNHMKDVLLSNTPAGSALFTAIANLESAGYEIWWGKEIRHPGDFNSPYSLGSFLHNPEKIAYAWFSIRKSQFPTKGRLVISSEEIVTEIVEHLFPVFDLAVRRS
jgi:hypothetical protein